jgi:hypothetical protein
MKGPAYTKNGAPDAHWNTLASCINVDETKVLYYWKGRHPSDPNSGYEGFGEMQFEDKAGKPAVGHGKFSDTILCATNPTKMKSIELRRCTELEQEAMTSALEAGDNEKVRRTVRDALNKSPF